MEQQLAAIHEHQKYSWSKFSPGWKKWDDLFVDFLKPMGDEIIRRLHLKENDLVLDVSAGTGDHSLNIATKLETGKVIITDTDNEILEIARENAIRRGINNIDTRTCDVSALPFADNEFDAISCRLGFMYFPDILLAAQEMRRVLKPGGKMAISVWNIPEKNFWATTILDAINRNINLSAPAPGEPGMFRCAKNGFMSSLFHYVGLKNISVKEVEGNLDYKTLNMYWTLVNEIGAPVIDALSKADEAIKQKIKREVNHSLLQKYPHGNIVIESSALVIYGEK